MRTIEIFPEVERVEPPPKERKPRRKSKRFGQCRVESKSKGNGFAIRVQNGELSLFERVNL